MLKAAGAVLPQYLYVTPVAPRKGTVTLLQVRAQKADMRKCSLASEYGQRICRVKV